MSSVPAFVDVSGGLCNGPGSFCARQYAAMLQVCCPCQLKKARPEVTQAGTTKQRSKGRSLHRTSPACCQAFLGGIRERSSGENEGSIPQWKGKSHVVCIPKLVSVGSSASTVRRCPAQRGTAEGTKEDSCKQQPVVQVPSLA